MADDKSTGLEAGAYLTPGERDNETELIVLQQVLMLHPESLTRSELVRELTRAGLWESVTEEAVHRAIRDLAGTGLLHPPCEAGGVMPTRAALRYYELIEGAE
jgi:hypothetical protein